MATTLLHLTDVHLPETAGDPVCDEDADERVKAAVTASLRAHPDPDAIVLTGDQTEDASVAAHRRLRRLIHPRGARVLAVPGNHDLAHAHAEGWPEPAVCELGSWRVVGVDTSIPGEIHGRVDVNALCEVLDGRDERFTVLAMHHPPRSPATHGWFRLLDADLLLDAVAARPQVRVLLSGHVHLPFAWQHAQCALLGGPSTLTPFSHADDDVVVGAGGPTGARILRLHDDGRCEHQLVVTKPTSDPEFSAGGRQ